MHNVTVSPHFITNWPYQPIPGAGAAMSVRMSANTDYTIVVLDGPSGLRADALTDAAGSKILPKGPAAMGFGGTAPRPPASPAPWVLVLRSGLVLIAAGSEILRRSRRTGTAAQP